MGKLVYKQLHVNNRLLTIQHKNLKGIATEILLTIAACFIVQSIIFEKRLFKTRTDNSYLQNKGKCTSVYKSFWTRG